MDETHTNMVFIDTIHAHFYIHAYSFLDDRITDACQHLRRPHVLPWGMCVHARVRVGLGAPATAPNRASPFRRRGPRAARLAGVLLGVRIQREYRRVEHRRGHHVVLCTRRFRPAARTACNALSF